MKLNYRWEPRWPAFAIGFGKTRANRGGTRYDCFDLILWAIVLEVTW